MLRSEVQRSEMLVYEVWHPPVFTPESYKYCICGHRSFAYSISSYLFAMLVREICGSAMSSLCNALHHIANGKVGWDDFYDA